MNKEKATKKAGIKTKATAGIKFNLNPKAESPAEFFCISHERMAVIGEAITNTVDLTNMQFAKMTDLEVVANVLNGAASKLETKEEAMLLFYSAFSSIQEFRAMTKKDPLLQLLTRLSK